MRIITGCFLAVLYLWFFPIHALCEITGCRDKNGNAFFADEPSKLPSDCVRQTLRSTGEARTPSQNGYPSTAANTAGSRGAEQPATIQDELLALLRERKYELLNRKIGDLQNAYETDFKNEKSMTGGLGGFEVVGPGDGELLDEWAARYPDQYQPFLCRGVYFFTRGHFARGYAFAARTSDEQFRDMRYFFDKALKDFQRALQIKPGLVHAYAFMIDLERMGGDSDPRALLDQALKINPFSFEARRAYLASLMPRWGGSLQAMKDFVEETRPAFTRNPELKALEGQIYFAEGLEAEEYQQYPKAIDLFTRAIGFGESAAVYLQRGNALQHQSHAKALPDFDRAISLQPFLIFAYYNRFIAREVTGNLRGATADLCRVVDLGVTARRIAHDIQAPPTNIDRVLDRGCPSRNGAASAQVEPAEQPRTRESPAVSTAIYEDSVFKISAREDRVDALAFEVSYSNSQKVFPHVINGNTKLIVCAESADKNPTYLSYRTATITGGDDRLTLENTMTSHTPPELETGQVWIYLYDDDPASKKHEVLLNTHVHYYKKWQRR